MTYNAMAQAGQLNLLMKNISLNGVYLYLQASGYPSVRPGLDGSHAVELPKGTYGVPDMMLHG